MYEVKFDSGQVAKLKENHILHVMNDGFPYRPGILPLDCRVVITGLRNHAELNGTIGHIAEYADASQRYEIRAQESGKQYIFFKCVFRSKRLKKTKATQKITYAMTKKTKTTKTGQLFRVKPDNILCALEPGEEAPELLDVHVAR